MGLSGSQAVLELGWVSRSGILDGAGILDEKTEADGFMNLCVDVCEERLWSSELCRIKVGSGSASG